MIEPSSLDLSLLHALNFDGGQTLDSIMVWVSGKFSWIPLYVLLLWGVYRKVGLRNFLWFVLAVVVLIILADQTATQAKIHLSKLRPQCYEPLNGLIHTVEGYRCGLYGTISSHAANTMGLSVLSASLIGRRWVWWALMIWVALISYSRIYLGVHYPFDVFFGLLEGAFWGFIVFVTYRKLVLKNHKL